MVINLRLDNWNDTIKHSRSTKYGANTYKKHEMKAIGEFLKGMTPITHYPIEIQCKWHLKNSLRDLDNCSLKSVLDQMQIMGILENDNIKHITKITYEAIKDTSDYLELEIKEL